MMKSKNKLIWVRFVKTDIKRAHLFYVDSKQSFEPAVSW